VGFGGYMGECSMGDGMGQKEKGHLDEVAFG